MNLTSGNARHVTIFAKSATFVKFVRRERCPVPGADSKQESTALHEVNWVLGVLLVVAPLTQQLHVVVGV